MSPISTYVFPVEIIPARQYVIHSLRSLLPSDPLAPVSFEEEAGIFDALVVPW
jgi:hypothetical protein